MRAKSSAFIVIFGPLLIILLVSLALNKPNTYELSVGYYTPDEKNPLTESFINELKDNNYIVIGYETNDSCIKGIKENNIHTCILFPENFEMGKEGQNKLEFYVDYSRTNIVYQIIEEVSAEISLKTSEISQDLTQVILSKILDTQKTTNENILSLITSKSMIDKIKEEVTKTKGKSSNLNFTIESITLNNVESSEKKVFGYAKDIRNKGYDSINIGKENASSSTINSLNSIESNIISIYNNTQIQHELFLELIDNTTSQIQSLENNIKKTKSDNQEIIKSLDTIKNELENLKTRTDEVKKNLETTQTNLENIDIINAENIVSPVRTEIKPVVLETNQLLFFFPYLLMLIILFIGLMLSSTLIIMENNSRAAFRNFTTPTKTESFVVATYLTSFVVLAVQIAIILGLSFYFLKTNVMETISMTVLILVLATSAFIVIGMIIGYLSRTQEAGTMLSIAIGSVFLLLSNLILPIETMSATIKELTKFNPYVVSSELLKKTMIFKITFSESINELIFLFLINIGLIILVFTINKISKAKYVERISNLKKKGYIYLPEDSYLKIGPHIIKDKKDLLMVLKHMSEEEFEEHVKKKNEMADWLSTMLKERKLAWNMRFKTREKMIKVMTKHLEKIEKKKKKKIKELT